MSEAYDLISGKTFYIATIEGDQPRVRPFGFIMESDGKMFFSTNNTKNVYKQLIENPKFEVATMTTGGDWVRLQGEAVFDVSIEAKRKAIDNYPLLKQLYNNAENPIFTLFYVKNGKATLYANREEKTVSL